MLETGLFGARESHRFGWSHQTYAEFFAGRYLRKLPLEQILSLLLLDRVGDPRVVAQLTEVAAWVSSARPDVFNALLDSDPAVLLQGDLTFRKDVERAALVSSSSMHSSRIESRIFGEDSTHITTNSRTAI